MKKTNEQKGITLVALIITIVVLLILAVVAIGAVRDSRIIAHAQNAGNDYTIAQEKEQIGLAVSEAYLAGTGTMTQENLVSGLDSNVGAGKYTIDSSNSEYYKVTITKSGREYKIYKNGKIEGPIPPSTPTEDSITLSQTSLELEVGDEVTITAILTGSLKAENIEWTTSADAIVSVTADVNNKVNATVKATSAGEATITASCGQKEGECNVAVTSKIEEKDIIYRQQEGDFYIKLNKDNTGEAGTSSGVMSTGTFEYIDVTSEIISNVKTNFTGKISEDVNYYSRAITFDAGNGTFMYGLLSEDEKILYLYGKILVLEDEVEWTAYGTESEYFLVGDSKAYFVQDGTKVLDYNVRIGSSLYDYYEYKLGAKYIVHDDIKFVPTVLLGNDDNPGAVINSKNNLVTWDVSHENNGQTITLTPSKTYSANDKINYEGVLKQIQ